MIELEVYAPGVRDLGKILELDHSLGDIMGLRYKVDRNHDIVYLEFDEPVTTSFPQLQVRFRRIGLVPRFVGTVPTQFRAVETAAAD